MSDALAATAADVGLLNASRPVPHVLVVWNQTTGRWKVDCDRCHVTPWHCGWWVGPAEIGQRLTAWSERHRGCRI